jgi:hypothetical protein
MDFYLFIIIFFFFSKSLLIWEKNFRPIGIAVTNGGVRGERSQPNILQNLSVNLSGFRFSVLNSLDFMQCL